MQGKNKKAFQWQSDMFVARGLQKKKPGDKVNLIFKLQSASHCFSVSISVKSSF